MRDYFVTKKKYIKVPSGLKSHYVDFIIKAKNKKEATILASFKYKSYKIWMLRRADSSDIDWINREDK